MERRDHFSFSVNYSLFMVVCGTFTTYFWEASLVRLVS